MICDVLRGLVGHQSHEGYLDVHILRVRALAAILELCRKLGKKNVAWVTLCYLLYYYIMPSILLNNVPCISVSYTSTYLEALWHRLSKPDVLFLGDLADVPVLHRNAGLSWVDTSLAGLHVAEDLDGIQGRSLVGIHPIGAFRGK